MEHRKKVAGFRVTSRNILALVAASVAVLAVYVNAGGADETESKSMHSGWKKLTPAEKRVIVEKGTEHPFTGEYVHHHEDGVYRCKRCGAALFPSDAKFDSGSGWPSFDSALPGAINEVPDPDGSRTEITCATCGAHLGHVFKGEGFTGNDTRHCVNSISLDFDPTQINLAEGAAGATADADKKEVAHAYFAGGCFWGVEYYFDKIPGVIGAESGYMGGRTENPTYEEVSYHGTGHAETVRITYDPKKVDYETLARLFFEIHDPTQIDRQGPDVGDQYRSAVFYADIEQKRTTEKLLSLLVQKGYDVATELVPAGRFYPAEEYHQDYYSRKGGTPYCHIRKNRFDE